MKKSFAKLFILLIVIIISSCLCACGAQKSDPLSQWNPDGNIKTIKAYVEDVCNEKSENFIPEEDRIVTMDMDGTLIREKDDNNQSLYAETALFLYMIDEYYENDVSIQNAKEKYLEAVQASLMNPLNAEKYKAESDCFYEMVGLMLEGLGPEELNERFFSLMDKPFDNEININQIGYIPMIDLCHYLMDMGFKIYFVSGSNRYAVYAITSSILNDENHKISFDNCIGMSYACEDFGADGSDVGFSSEVYDQSENLEKCRLIIQEIGKTPVLAIGNSSGDTEMLNYALSNPGYQSLGVVINHDDAEREYQYNDEKMRALANENGWLCVSMKDDFKTVFE